MTEVVVSSSRDYMSHLYPDYNWYIRLQDLSPIIVNQNPFLFLLFLVLPVVSRTVANTERKENLSDFSPFLLNQVRRLVWRDPDSWGGIKLSSPILSTVACLCKPNHTTREMRRGRDALNVYLCSPNVQCPQFPVIHHSPTGRAGTNIWLLLVVSPSVGSICYSIC